MTENNTPNSAGDIHSERGEDWALTNALLNGSKHLRNENYLPKYESESEQAYEVRSARSFSNGRFAQAIRDITGVAFDKPTTPSDDMPPQMRDWCKDIDLAGKSISVFMRQFFSRALAYGVCYVMVDYVKLKAGATRDDAARVNARPYMLRINAKNMLEYVEQTVDGETICVYARFRETVKVREGYRWTKKTRVREYEPGIWRVYEEGESGWAVRETGDMVAKGKPLKFVPVKAFYTYEMAEDGEARPPLQLLAEKNLEHFQSASDQRNILTFARFPMLAVSGQVPQTVDSEGKPVPLVLGPRKILSTQEVQGKWYYVEAEGNSIEAGRKDLEALDAEMNTLSLAPLLQDSGNITATATAVNTATSNSAVESMVNNEKSVIDQCFRWMALFSGAATPGTIVLNTDFAAGIGKSDESSTLRDMRKTGDISRRTEWKEQQRRAVLSEDFDPDKEEGALELEAEEAHAALLAAQPAPETDEETGKETDEDSADKLAA